MKISPPAALTAPQACAVSAKSPSRTSEDFTDSGFAQALFAAGISGRTGIGGPAATASAWLPSGPQLANGTLRATRSSSPPATQEGGIVTTAAAVAVPTSASAALPLLVQPFTLQAGDLDETAKAVPSAPGAEPAAPALVVALASGTPRAGRNNKPQATQEGGTDPTAAAAAGSLPASAYAALPLVVQPFARPTGDLDEATPTQSSSTPPAQEASTGTEQSFAVSAVDASLQAPARASRYEAAAATQGSSQGMTENAGGEAATVPPATASSGSSAASYRHASAQLEGTAAETAQPAGPAEVKTIPEVQPQTASAPLDDAGGDFADSGFAHVLIAAGISSSTETSSPDTTTSTWVRSGTPPVSGTRAGRNAMLQPKQDGRVVATAAASAATVPVAPATLPRVVQAISRQTGDLDKVASAVPSTAGAETAVPAVRPAQEAPTGTEQRSAARIADSSGSAAPSPQSVASAPGDLAIAARVQPATKAAPQPASQHEEAAAAQAPSKRTVESDRADATSAPPVTASSASSAASYGQAFAQPEAPSTRGAAATTAALPAEVKTVMESQSKTASAPLKDISIQVSQPGTQKVEVRVVQQSGELRVAVRTGDSDLAHGLQQNLSDLVGRLQETGFRAEGWRPGGSTVDSPAASEARAASDASRSGNQQSSSGNSQGQEGERQQSRSQRPAWLEELEASINGNEWSQGAPYGIGN